MQQVGASAKPVLPDAPVEVRDDEELTEVMIQLRQLWKQALGKDDEKFGAITSSSGFSSVGSNSLLIVRFQSNIQRVFNDTIRLVDLLSANTLDQMARRVERAKA